MQSTNAEIASVHCCLGEPGCLAGIMLLFQIASVHQVCDFADVFSFALVLSLLAPNCP